MLILEKIVSKPKNRSQKNSHSLKNDTFFEKNSPFQSLTYFWVKKSFSEAKIQFFRISCFRSIETYIIKTERKIFLLKFCIAHTLHYSLYVNILENVATRHVTSLFFQKQQGFRNVKNRDIRENRGIVTKFTGVS
jgi:hypothetical protein